MNKIINMSLTIVFKVILEMIYYEISNLYIYGDIFHYEFVLNKYMAGWVVFFVGSILLLASLNNLEKNIYPITYYCLQIIFYLNFVPTCAVFGISDYSIKAFMFFMLFWTVIYIMIYLSKKIGLNVYSFLISEKNARLKEILTVALICICSLFIILENYKYNGAIKLNMNFDDTYSIRENYSESASTLEGLLMFGFGGVINPFLALYSLTKKNINFSYVLL